MAVPHFDRLSDTEVVKLRRRKTPREGLLDQYFSFIDTLKPGDWGSIILENDDSQRAVKRRLTTASKQRGYTVKYKKSDSGKILFELRSAITR